MNGGAANVDDRALLSLWETASALPPAGRALCLARHAHPETDFASLPVGRRDAALLQLHRSLFGDALPLETNCPNCRGLVAVELEAGALASLARDDRGGVFDFGDRTWPFRLPTAGDLVEVTTPFTLTLRCVPDAAPGDVSAPGFEDALSAAISTADPLAEIEIEVVCAECGHAWSEVLDVASYVWTEIDRAARNTLGTIVTLARAFGWTESEVLALGPARRALYLAEAIA